MSDRELLEAAYAAYRPGENYIRLVERNGEDPLAATRRAIVRAAAEIGRSMT
jgi:hypothetical protein